ncbi:MAG: hypothetical protein WCR96_02285 [Candidatus Methanomethylophilaceae archaeon]
MPDDVDYSLPTPETDAYLTKIDGECIDLEQLRAVLHDMEIQRNYWKSEVLDVEGMYNAVIETQICELNLTELNRHEAEACVLAWMLKTKLYMIRETSRKWSKKAMAVISHELDGINDFLFRQ